MEKFQSFPLMIIFKGTKITIMKGDIVSVSADCIVNAANHTLLGGGGVDGAIHHAAGPKLLEECKTLHGCQTGEAKITKGYDLKAKYIIHTVGPVYGKEKGREKELLATCYLQCLTLAKKMRLKKIAFPAISTGAYGYPKEEAAEIVYQTLTDYLKQNNFFAEIMLVLYSSDSYRLYKKTFGR